MRGDVCRCSQTANNLLSGYTWNSRPKNMRNRRNPRFRILLASALANRDLNQFLAFRIRHMNGTRDTRIETVDRAQDLKRLLGIVHDMCILQRCLVGARLSVRIARTGVPGTRNDRLVIGNLAVFDDNPM